MISRVEVTPLAMKQLARAPSHIQRKLHVWVWAVEDNGLEFYVIRHDVVDFVSIREVRKHDYCGAQWHTH